MHSSSSSRLPATHLFKLAVGATLLLAVAAGARAQEADKVPVLEVKAGEATGHVNPHFYGLMTEEINYSYDGGLYGELVINRSFDYKEFRGDRTPYYWQVIGDTNLNGISIVTNEPMNGVQTNSLKLTALQADDKHPVGFANEGYWGIPVRPDTRYRASFYAKAEGDFTGPLTVAIIGTNQTTVYASAQVRRIGNQWKKYEVTLKTGDAPVTKDALLAIWTTKPGTAWFNLVSLFPPTYNNRPNGNRPDIMQLLAEMKPGFLRFPGGNYLEGNTVATRFQWKQTIGDVSQRPGHVDDAWRYWSSDGMGLMEFLQWCEDLHMEPLLAVYAGYSMQRGAQTNSSGVLTNMDFYVQEALDEIEYVTGAPSTKWGAQRAKDGHRAPFELNYVEIGNEDNLGSAPRTYEKRFADFATAMRAKYPKVKLVATARVTNTVPDLIDEHYYRGPEEEDMEIHAHDYDNRRRTGPKVIVGEWATQSSRPDATPNLGDALGDAAWMTGMERNSDLVVMESYAPLFVNVNPGGQQWATDLIGYDTLESYGSPSYYAQKMFSLNHGDLVLATGSQDIPMKTWQPLPRQGRRGQPPQIQAPRQVPTVFFSATRDSKSRTIYVKVVNTAGAEQPVRVHVSGVARVEPKGEAVVMRGSSPKDTNKIKERTKIVPVTMKVDGLSTDFARTLPAYSITILKLQGK